MLLRIERFIDELAIEASPRGVTAVRTATQCWPPEPGIRSLLREARRQIAEYLAGKRVGFTVPLDLAAATPFQRRVLDAAASIPWGETRSYGWIAAVIGVPRAHRAVGTALARNPVPLLVPCHRVLRHDGALGGFSLGIGPVLKAALLRLERATSGGHRSSTRLAPAAAIF